EQVVVPGESGRAYLVHVVSAAAGSPSYSLRVQSLTADLKLAAHGVVTGMIASGDQAYYLLAAAASGSLQQVLTSAADVQGDLHVEVLDPDTLAVLASGQASGPPGAVERSSVVVKQSQSVLLHVFGDAGAHGGYSLEFTNLDQFATSSGAS